MLIKVAQDTVYGLGFVDVRFTVDESIPEGMIPVACLPQLKKAIDQFEKLGDGKGHHYKFRDDIPIRWHYSRIQADPQVLHEAEKALSLFDRSRVDGLVDVVARVYFEQPLIQPDPETLISLGEDHGFRDMPDQYHKRLAEASK